MNRKALAWLMAATALPVATTASAQVLEDFEGGTYMGPGTVVTDPADPTNNALFLRQGNAGWVDFAVTGNGTATIRTYDFGAVSFDPMTNNPGRDQGPRWGVFGNDAGVPTAAAASLINQSYFASFNGYGTNGGPGSDATSDATKAGNWFSTRFGGARLTPLDTVGTGSTVMPEIDEPGGWTDWTFEVMDGTVNISAAGNSVVTTLTGFGDLAEIWIYGGRPNPADELAIVGALFDDITWTPASMRLPGDANNDGRVDVSDLGILAANFRMAVTNGEDDADFNTDGTVDVTDLGILAANFRAGTMPLTQFNAESAKFGLPSIPEPASIAALGALGLMGLRRRR